MFFHPVPPWVAKVDFDEVHPHLHDHIDSDVEWVGRWCTQGDVYLPKFFQANNVEHYAHKPFSHLWVYCSFTFTLGFLRVAGYVSLGFTINGN